MPSTVRLTLRTGLIWAMALLVVPYIAVLARPANGPGQLLTDTLGLLAMVLPAAMCWLAVARIGYRRGEALFAAAGVSSYVLASSYYGAVLIWGAPMVFPSPPDLAFFLLYPLLLASLAIAVHRHVPVLAWSAWLDCTVGSLGAAAVLAVVLGPVLDPASSGSASLATVVAAARPMCDLVILSAIAGIAVLRARMGRRWGLLMLGLLAFAAADVGYALEVTRGEYVIGTPLDAGFAIGLGLIAIWVDGISPAHERSAQVSVSAPTRATALVIPVVATAAALGVLVAGTQIALSGLAVALAGVTIVAATARAQLAFRQLAGMADLRRREAGTDALTGLPNRRALSAEVQARLTDSGRRRALLLLDLDKFKEVNDSVGHHIGDLLLVQVGGRLRERLRPEDLLARLGGDEFAVLLEDAGRAEAEAAAAALRATLADGFDLEGVALHSAASIGIALFPDDGVDLGALMRKADIAMYRAKTSGAGVHVYANTDESDGSALLRTVEELRAAIGTGQLVLHYQPKVELDTGEVHGVEALVRWNHPTRGLLYPVAFLALAEEAGLMRALTDAVLTMALDQAAAWRDRGEVLTVAVNLSSGSLVEADLPERIAAMLAQRALPPRALQLEITERFLLADRGRARDILGRLRASGVQLAVDGFGGDYSPLHYLRDLPIDELKLDRSFAPTMAGHTRAATLVAATIGLAHSLGLRMVAEGVETNDAYADLARLGCDEAQGYLMSRPLPAAELTTWLGSRRSDRALPALGTLVVRACSDG